MSINMQFQPLKNSRSLPERLATDSHDLHVWELNTKDEIKMEISLRLCIGTGNSDVLEAKLGSRYGA